MSAAVPGTADTPRSVAAAHRAGNSWLRFWLHMLIAAVAFNIVAGLVTWFFIFPRLFPGR